MSTESEARSAVAPLVVERPGRRPVHHRPRGLVVLLHGGAEEGDGSVTWRSKPWLRARLLGRQVAPALHRAGLDLWLVRYRQVGWNPEPPHPPAPVRDARWVLEEARTRYPRDRGVVLLGHSMGARTALSVADDPLVRGVVALAPWFPDGEPVDAIEGKDLVALHGRADRVTAYSDTEAFMHRAAGVARHAELVDMGQLGHTMMDGLSTWNATIRRKVLGMYLR